MDATLRATPAGQRQAHVQYWTGLLKQGTPLAFGPVADPKGVYGIAVIEAAPGRDVHELVANAPVIDGDLGFAFEVFPMLSAVVRPAAR